MRHRVRRRRNPPVPAPYGGFGPSAPNPRHLAEAFEAVQREVEMYQSQLDQLNAAADNMPGEMAEYVRASGRVMLEGSLKRAIEQRDGLQKAMEEISASEIGSHTEEKEASR